MIYDVVVIGAGVVGAFIAREFARYKLDVCVLEKEADCSMGASGANSGIIHAGFDTEPGSLKSKMNVLGNELMEQAAKELSVQYEKTGSLVLAFNQEDMNTLHVLLKRGVENGVPNLEILTPDKVMAKEPNVTSKVKGALYAPSAAIISPFELTCAAMENAVSNGVQFLRDCEVKEITYDDIFYTIHTSKGEFRGKYVINAAGVYADVISSMVGDHSFKITPRKGEYLLFDKSQRSIINTVIFQPPSDRGKGILVTPTTEGNLLIGPNAIDARDKSDSSTSSAGLEEVAQTALKSVPSIDLKQVITSFAGLRATPTEGDFILRESKTAKRFIHAAGIESPGLTSAPAIGPYIVEICRSIGMQLEINEQFSPERKDIKRFIELDTDEQNVLIKGNAMYGNIICRCEKITEAEIVECIKRPAGAVTVDGVKRRVRAGMGRCQGGFCLPRVMEILSRELDVNIKQVTKQGEGSKILIGKKKNAKAGE